jgi:hypothetical protein
MQNRESSKIVRRVNSQLKKNRSVLEELLQNKPEGQAKASQRFLTERNFDFQYFTHIYENKKGTRYFFCYEYGYLPLDGGWYLLVKRD